MKAIWHAMVAGLMVILAAPAMAERYRDRDVEMIPVSQLDLERYLGKWYEIARFPNRFEKGCEGVTAEYALRDDGKISVLNTCRIGAPDGEVKTADGQAKVVGPGKLSVTFVPWLPFARGDYWVLHVDEDYTLAVVGAPRGTTGWILARSPSISDEARATAEEVLRRNGYDPARLRDVRH
ncbi:apolipoprotein D and lipocalin family protein [Aliiruegeria haliotis]|uniref:Outer membrane lipoprotein Blc n=1 Tax=Aliiruegeria haliotis TaxID=1280846 RepID=A0A2T0RPQ1_9RHOB|nr:lipocalin family protein [Aliiruegeria haliotis]PRY23122.1 apolipoprotein D and lipocalin family protein [Aliiruegeria haliotis]